MNDNADRIFVFHGCDRKVGTTMTALGIAKLIAAGNSDISVLFAAVNGNDDIPYLGEDGISIDDIRTTIENNLIGSSELKFRCGHRDNLYYIRGTGGVFSHRNFTVDFPGLLITKAAEVFDIIVVDCGNDPDSGLCVGSLKTEGMQILVVNQNETSLSRLEKRKNVYDALGVNFQFCIVNRFRENDPHDLGYIKSRIFKETDEVFMLKDESAQSYLCEIDRQLLCDRRCHGYREDLNYIAGFLMKKSGTESVSVPRLRKKIFDFL